MLNDFRKKVSMTQDGSEELETEGAREETMERNN
jgi:hypothetical protein